MNFKKWLATLLLAIGIIGFFINTEQKGDKQVFSERISNTEKHLLKVEIENGHHYEFKFWGS